MALARGVGVSLLLVWLGIPFALADTHALLIGVSGYPSLPENLRLQGPRNDVESMFRALVARGVRQDNIAVLADGVTQPATRRAIFEGFEAILAKVRRGDWLILYLSGHGSQQPQLKEINGYKEPDGLDEIFLPYDVARWNGRIGKVENAIVDDEIGYFIGRANGRGVNVWAIFDTCHAGDMAKAGFDPTSDARFRYVDPSSLDIPSSLLNRATNTNKSIRKAVARSHREAMGVNFYAAQANEQAPEESLASFRETNGPQKVRQGLFTWHLARLLPAWNGSFHELAKQINAAYRAERRPFPTPAFEGGLETIPDFLVQPDKERVSASSSVITNKR